MEMTRFLLIDDDSEYRKLAEGIASSFGLTLDTIASPEDLNVSQFTSYSVIIIDFQLHKQTGLDVARHLCTSIKEFAPQLIIISGIQDWSSLPIEWPMAVKRFLPKRIGIRSIILAAYTLCKQLPKASPS